MSSYKQWQDVPILPKEVTILITKNGGRGASTTEIAEFV